MPPSDTFYHLLHLAANEVDGYSTIPEAVLLFQSIITCLLAEIGMVSWTSGVELWAQRLASPQSAMKPADGGCHLCTVRKPTEIVRLCFNYFHG